MGSAEFDQINKRLVIHSHIITYGNAATEQLTRIIREEIECMWNDARGRVPVHGEILDIGFSITAQFAPALCPEDIFDNVDPRINYFRIEKFAQGNISFVDGIGCNTGYLLLDNLYIGSTTAAHEYGHTLGLKHPTDIDLRGQGVPGIMYPRGTLVDAPYQYNPEGRAGDSSNGGTMNPVHRRVLQKDIVKLRLERLTKNDCTVGEFSSIWHPDHAEIDGGAGYDA